MEFKNRVETAFTPTAPNFIDSLQSHDFPSTTDGLHIGARVVLINKDDKRVEVEVTEVVRQHQYKGKISSTIEPDEIVDFQELQITEYLTA